MIYILFVVFSTLALAIGYAWGKAEWYDEARRWRRACEHWYRLLGELVEAADERER